MSEIFVKTPKGAKEIETRIGDMPLRVRRILILVDGKHTVDDISALALADDLTQTLELLEENGYIELIRLTEDAMPPLAHGEEPPPILTFREIPATPNAKEMEMAKHFIMNTLKTFCGPMSHLSIVKAASAATTHEELRASFAPWYEAIIETSSGRSRAEELSAMLLKVI